MIEDLLRFEFLQNALLSGLLIGLICPIVGVFLVVRRLSLIADTLSHVALSGVAAGMLLIKYVASLAAVNPIYFGMVFAVIGAFFVEKLRHVYRHYQELSLPILLSAGAGLSVVLISLADGFNADLFGYLFGSLIAVSRADLWVIMAVGIGVISTILLLYKELFYLSFEEEGAITSGIPRGPLHLVFVILVALVIAISLNIVGVLLVSSLITLPAAAALQLSRSFKQMFFFAVLFGETAVISGLVISYYFDLASGGTIVILSAAILSIVIMVKKIFHFRLA